MIKDNKKTLRRDLDEVVSYQKVLNSMQDVVEDVSSEAKIDKLLRDLNNYSSMLYHGKNKENKNS